MINLLMNYFWRIFAGNPHTVTQPNKVSSKVWTAVITWYSLKSNYLQPHLPRLAFHLNPVGSHSKKQPFCIVSRPSICSGWDFP